MHIAYFAGYDEILVMAESTTSFLLFHSPSYRKPPDKFTCNKSEVLYHYKNLSSVYNMTLSKYKSVVKTTGTQVRKHSLILIYVSQVRVNKYLGLPLNS